MAEASEVSQGKAALASLQGEIDDFVGGLLTSYKPRKLSSGKIVRDPVFGYHLLHPHEVNIVDSPLIQRLRYIHQTALAYLVYPSANHTRFEHSLGVATLAERIATSLNRQADDRLLGRNDILELRLAALLHDCGHGLFSHLSESIMSQHFAKELRLIRLSGFFGKEDVSLGEIVSSLIVRSEPFQNLWNDIRVFYGNIQVDIEKVAKLIVGEASPFEQYKSDIITGPFDADKLDYFTRDAHFTGIKVEIDIDRILLMIHILNIAEERKRLLVVKAGGSHHLEQILFDKMTLYSSIYHHHKIRALECMIRAIFEIIWKDTTAIKNHQLKFERITDYLRISEFQFLVKAQEERLLEDRVRRVLDRNILKRALIINATTMEKGTASAAGRVGFQNLSGSSNADEVRTIAQLIFEGLPSALRGSASIHDLWLDLPSNPPLSEDADRCKVDMEPGSPPVPLRKLFPAPEWVEVYADNKWTGHVLYLPDDDINRRKVGDTAAGVLRELYDVQFLPSAVNSCFKSS